MNIRTIELGAVTMLVVSLLRSRSRPARPIDNPDIASPVRSRPDPSDLSAGHIVAGTKARAVRTILLAILWTLATSPVVFMMPQLIAQRGYTSLWLLSFPLGGAGLLIWAARRAAQWREYGESRFDMATTPGQIGGALEGVIHIDRPLPAMQSVTLKLNCINRTRTDGEDSSERVIWSDEQSVLSDGTDAIKVAFYIPGDCCPTDSSDRRDNIFWRLSASAPGRGVPYEIDFEVPVGRVELTAAEVAEAGELRSRRAHEVETQHQLGAQSQFRIALDAEGATEIYFPAFRNPSLALIVAGFAGFWTSILALIHHQHAPAIITGVFGFFDLILILWVIALWIGTTRVVVRPDAIVISKGLFGLALSTSTVAAGSISDVRAGAGSTAGNTGYSLIQMRHDGGRMTQFGDGIRSRKEADWLVARISQLLGLHPGSE